MPLKDNISKTVEVGKVVHTQNLGFVLKNAAGATVKLPAHVAKFFEDHGVVS